MRDTIEIQPKTWTTINATAVATMRMACLGNMIELIGTATSAKPTDVRGAQPLVPGETITAEIALADLFPDAGTANLFIHAYSETGSRLSYAHA